MTLKHCFLIRDVRPISQKAEWQQLWSKASRHIRKKKPADIKIADWNLVKVERRQASQSISFWGWSLFLLFFLSFFSFFLSGWSKMSEADPVVVEFDRRWIDKKSTESCWELLEVNWSIFSEPPVDFLHVTWTESYCARWLSLKEMLRAEFKHMQVTFMWSKMFLLCNSAGSVAQWVSTNETM